MSEPNPPAGETPVQLNYSNTPNLGEFTWQDFIAFRVMITVPVIKILFWAGVIISVLTALGLMVTGLFSLGRGGFALLLIGLVWIGLGPLLVRIYCELLIVIFKINETLIGIHRTLERR